MELTTTMGKLTGDVQKDMKMLMNFVFNQTEEMRYLMHNLDVTNFNDLGLARYENGRMQIYTKALNVKAEELKVQIQDVEQTVKTEIKADIDGIKTTVVQHAIGINANTKEINTLKNTTIPGLSSTIQQNADKIALVVQQTNGVNTINAAAIALSINNAGSLAMINADQIQMTGSVKFLSAADVGRYGSTIIDGGRIQSGTISGDYIYGGTIEGVNIISTGGWDVTIADGRIIFGSTYEDSWGQINGGQAIEQYDAGVIGFRSNNGFFFDIGESRWQFTESGLKKVY